MRRILQLAMLGLALVPLLSAQNCRQIRGRAVYYRGDGFFAIWHVGTHHVFSPANASSVDFVCRYFDCESPGRQPALFADFTICPTEPFRTGAAQSAIVKEVKNPRVVADWPAPASPRGYLDDFYKWYVPHISGDAANLEHLLDLARWDLSPELYRRLKEDTQAQAACTEIVGIDFNPFLLSQYPADNYEVDRIIRHGAHYEADLYEVHNGQRGVKPAVTVLLARQADRWVLLNFVDHARKIDLLEVLKSPHPACSRPRADGIPKTDNPGK